jgi:hypothetical protein
MVSENQASLPQPSFGNLSAALKGSYKITQRKESFTEAAFY